MFDPAYYQPVEHFGITAPYGFSGYDIESINVRAALDWGADSTYPLPPNVEYIHVLRVKDDRSLPDDFISWSYRSFTGLIQGNLGEVWIIGNEPDTSYGNQDNINPLSLRRKIFRNCDFHPEFRPKSKIGIWNNRSANTN